MGYYTKYDLFLGKDTPEEILKKDLCDTLGKMSRYEGCWVQNTKYSYEMEEPCKWYDSHKDMIKFSKKKEFKKVLFRLECNGEEGEEYHQYYKNGKTHTIEPTIVWPDFDESMLE